MSTISQHLGFRRGLKTAEKKRRELAGQPYCGCGHHISYHGTRAKMARGVAQTEYAACWHPARWYQSNSTCRCQHYSGPTPLPEYYAQDL